MSQLDELFSCPNLLRKRPGRQAARGVGMMALAPVVLGLVFYLRDYNDPILPALAAVLLMVGGMEVCQAVTTAFKQLLLLAALYLFAESFEELWSWFEALTGDRVSLRLRVMSEVHGRVTSGRIPARSPDRLA